jgi:hypothetical protein
MNYKLLFFLPVFLIIFILVQYQTVYAQEEEQVRYYQMEPLDDSLFIHIQDQLFITPPDPKAEIIVDLRDPNNQTISIKGALYPLLALKPETRAQVITYPFKINLEEQTNYGSVFTRVLEKIRLDKIAAPPSVFQISSTLSYINPFIQLLGGERFGISLKSDAGFSFGTGTPYSGALESNMVEANFHILGFHGGIYSNIDAITEIQTKNNHNNVYVTNGFQLGYVIPLGNFFELSYLEANKKFSESQKEEYTKNKAIVFNSDGSIKYSAYFVEGSYLNFEMRYPISIMGSTRGKFYGAHYLDEWHIGYTGRELSVAGSTFDFRFDAMFDSPVRRNQIVFELMVQKIMDYWGFSAFALGPSASLTTLSDGSYGFSSIFFNLRVKVGTSL